MNQFDKVKETLAALPVAPNADDVVKSVMDGKVTVLAAPTGSGKSMLVPAMLADATQEEVIVLVPRRFLATDAASNVSEMAGTKLGEEVGYAVGKMAGERSQFSDNTKLKFMTYGYAISSGLINTAKNIVLDEVHEADTDISLARAILYERKKTDTDMRLLEMSATVNASRQAGYWSPNETKIVEIKDQPLLCEGREQKAGVGETSVAQTAIDLMTKENRNGIAVFCPGVKEVERTAEQIQELVRTNKIPNVEVVQIYSKTSKLMKKRARAEPHPGWKKIIVGTNVIESGVNLRWVDAGISDGFGKIPYDRPDTGAYALMLEDLPQWRIIQQRGRINRDPKATGFDKGIFILHSNTPLETRLIHGYPELERCSLMQFAFHAASLGYAPESLHIDAKIEPSRWHEAKEDLMRLGLVRDDWSLTADGKYVTKLPLSPQTGAMLCEANRIDMTLKLKPKLLPDAIILAALAELPQSLRKKGNVGHGLEGSSDIHGGSDLLDSLKAYLKLASTPAAQIIAQSEQASESGDANQHAYLDKAIETLQQQCKEINVDYNSFCETMSLVNEIGARHKKNPISPDAEPHEFDTQRYNALKQVILNGHANRLFQLEHAGEEAATYRDLLRDYGNRRSARGDHFGGYPISGYSALKDTQATARTPLLVGKLRELPARKGSGADGPDLVIDQATSIPSEVFIAWAAAHQPPLTSAVDIKGKELSAQYADRAVFTMPLSKQAAQLTTQLNQLKQAGGGDGYTADHYTQRGR